MNSNLDFAAVQTELSAPLYLRLASAPFANTPISIREHLPSSQVDPAHAPTVVVTFHPGFLTGSLAERDYFTAVADKIFHALHGRVHLRQFTVNHPGYNVPPTFIIDRFQLEPYSIEHQPQAMDGALAWLFNSHLAASLSPDQPILWLAYGHSMGGLALSRYQSSWLTNWPRLQAVKLLSAPAFFLHPETKAGFPGLEILNGLKRTVGRFPLYRQTARGLYHLFAPRFYERDAERFSIGSLAEYGDFRQVDPFLLLEQGRELIRFEATAVVSPALLANTHIILAQQDGMIDLVATEALIESARQEGHTVQQYEIDSTHLLELDAPDEVKRVIERIVTEII